MTSQREQDENNTGSDTSFVFQSPFRDQWIDAAFAAKDGWALMGAIAVGERALTEARNTIETVDGILKQRRCADLLDIGAGVGRHLKPLQDRGYAACGVEPSEILCEVANTYLGKSAVQRGSFKDLGHLPPADAYFLMSDTLSLLAPTRHLDLSPLARQESRVPPLLVVEVSCPGRWPRAGVQPWAGPPGMEVVATVEIDESVATRIVRFSRGDISFALRGDQPLLTEMQVKSMLVNAGLVIHDMVYLQNGGPCQPNVAENFLVIGEVQLSASQP